MNNSKQSQTNALSDTPLNMVVSVFLLLMFAVFPLFVGIYADGQFPFIHFDDGFFNIRHDKYYFFVTMALIAVVAEIMVIVTKGSPELKGRKLSTVFKPLSFTDWSALALVVSCSLSTLFSPYPELAFWGEINKNGVSAGRNNGLFLILVYVLIYFVITRFFRYKETVFTALAISCSLVYLLTVLNGYYLDPLNMLTQFKVSQPNVYMEFFSTKEKKNMLASFICVTLPVSIVMSVLTEKLWRRIVYLIASGLGMMAMIIGDSDSAMLGTAVFIAVFLVVFARNAARLKRFFLALCVMLASIGLLRLFSAAMHDNYKELGSIPKALLFSSSVYVLLAVCAAITALLYIIEKQQPDIRFPKAVSIALGALFGLAALTGFTVFLYFSVIDKETPLGDMEKLLRMNDAWGTHRGIMWLRSFDVFAAANPWQKLFGTGPDTFYYAFEPYFKQLQEYGNSSTDAAHNEYINYLITIGAAGLASYLAFTGGALVRGFKSAKSNPAVLCCAAAVIAYLAQATVNIALPISTPLFIVFVSLCEAFARHDKA